MDMLFYTEDRDVKLEAAELALEKAHLAYDTINRLSDLRTHEVELQCFAESADTDTYLSYMEAAEAQISEKKESALKKLWEKIKALFRALKEKFFGKNKGKDLPKNDVVYVKKPFGIFLKKIKSMAGSIITAIKNTKKKLSEQPAWKKFLVLLGAVAVAGGYKIIRARKNGRYYEEEIDELTSERHAIRNSDITASHAGSIIESHAMSQLDPGEKVEKVFMRNEDFMRLTGAEFNEGYTSIDRIFNICMNMSDELADNLRFTAGIEEDRAMEFEEVLKLLKPILSSIHVVRIQDDEN